MYWFADYLIGWFDYRRELDEDYILTEIVKKYGIKVIIMIFRKITKKEYVRKVTGLSNPLHFINSFNLHSYKLLDIEETHDAIMDFIIKFVDVNDAQINEILDKKEGFIKINEKSRDYILIKEDGDICYENKKGTFYSLEMNEKLYLIHQYNDSYKTYTLKASYI